MKEEATAVLPDTVSDEAGAAAALAGLKALQALRDLGQVHEGARVLVHGASGGVGTLAIQVARQLGAEVTTTSSERTLDLCRHLGASQALDYAAEPWAVLRGSLDVVFEVFGNLAPARVRNTFAGRGVFISTVPSLRRVVRDRLTRWSHLQERLVVVKPSRDDLGQLARWLASGSIDAVIDSRFPLAQVHDAFRAGRPSRRCGSTSSTSTSRTRARATRGRAWSAGGWRGCATASGGSSSSTTGPRARTSTGCG